MILKLKDEVNRYIELRCMLDDPLLEDGEVIDKILDEMDAIWSKLSKEDQDFISDLDKASYEN